MSMKDSLMTRGADQDVMNLLMKNRIVIPVGSNKADQERIGEKYKALGFMKQAHIKLKHQGRSKFLWLELSLRHNWTYGAWWRRTFEAQTVLKTIYETKKKLFGSEQVEIAKKYLRLMTPTQYGEEIPEQILDTMLKYKDDFKAFYIGTIEAHVPIQDPILFGAEKEIKCPHDDQANLNFEQQFAVLGVWGTDWFEVNLNSSGDEENNNR